MKDKLQRLLFQAIEKLGLCEGLQEQDIELLRPKNIAHGNWSSNLALKLSAQVKTPPRDLAQKIIDHLPACPEIKLCEIAGGGFINFHLQGKYFDQVIESIIQQASDYGLQPTEAKQKETLIEYLSANPTGPLHIGHGRIAVFGSALTAILRASGRKVVSEYYVNDAGRQIDILVVSVLQRCTKLHSSEKENEVINQYVDGLDFYQGEYLQDIGRQVFDKYTHAIACYTRDLMALGQTTYQADAEKRTQAIIDLSRESMPTDYASIRQMIITDILTDIQEDLSATKVQFDRWYLESSLQAHLAEAITEWQAREDVYQADGALWFAATRYGDDKDRVLVRENGVPTYFAMDILYHHQKRQRGYEKLINILGSDHHGYLTRIREAVRVFYGGEPIQAKLAQFVHLHEGNQPMQMSTRKGQFITFRALRERIGIDATRFYYLLTEIDQKLDFDLDLVVKHNNENPLYYVQYAAVRCYKVLAKAATSEEDILAVGLQNLALLQAESELHLKLTLEKYTEVIQVSAEKLEPAILIRYLRELAQAVHTNYADQVYLVEDNALRSARLSLIRAALQVLQNALLMLDISIPQEM